jgi:hypothetical protein
MGKSCQLAWTPAMRPLSVKMEAFCQALVSRQSPVATDNHKFSFALTIGKETFSFTTNN